MKAFLTTLLASITLSSPVLAQPLPADHRALVDSLIEDGVGYYVNTPNDVCFNPKTPNLNGAYITTSDGNRFLVVCQDLREDETQTVWTPNDLDTIRHEAIHAIQDCLDGDKTDGEMVPLFSTYEEVIDAYGVENSMAVISNYLESYADRQADIQLEVEAFYGAENYSGGEVNTWYNTYCR